MFYLRTFGGLSLVDDQSPSTVISVGASRLALLAVLAAAGERGASRDRLLAIFWAETDQRRARGALKQAIYSLRQLLGGADLILGTSELRLNPERITADVIEFRRALADRDPARAVALYHGPFLDGFFVRNAPEFEEWVERERARLGTSLIEAVEGMRRSAEERGDLDDAVAWWRRLVQVDPLSSRYALGYMRALAAAGQRESAITHAEVHTTLVRQELDAQAAPEIIRLKEELRAGNAPSIPAAAAAGRSQPTVAPGRGGETGSLDATQVSSAGIRVPDPAAGDTDRPPLPRARAAPHRRRRSRLVAAGVAALAAAVSLAVYVFLRGGADRTGVVVVAPLVNETGEPHLQAVGRLAADWITQVLIQSGVANVIDPRTPLNAADTTRGMDAAATLALARRTGAESIVQGAVYAGGDSLRLQARLIRVRDGRVLIQPVTATGLRSDPAAIVEALAQRLVGVMAAVADRRFTPLAEGLVAPPRYDAYLAFQRGLAHLARRALQPAAAAFLEAARLDTTFAQAKLYAMLWPTPAQDSLVQAVQRQRDRLTPYDRAFLDHTVASIDWNYENMLLAAREMVRLAPTDVQAQLLHAQAAILTNRFSEAVATMHRPEPVRGWMDDSHLLLQVHLDAHHHLGDFAGELEEVTRGQHRVEFNPCVQYYLIRPLAALGRESQVDSLIASCQGVPDALVPGAGHLTAGGEYSGHGHPEAAARALARARAWYERNQWTDALITTAFVQRDWSTVAALLRPDFEAGRDALPSFGFFGVAAANLGDTTAANDVVRRLDENYARSRATNVAAWAALIVAALGRKEEAISRLREAMDRGFPQIRGFHGPMRPALDPLRGDPRFEAMRSDRR